MKIKLSSGFLQKMVIFGVLLLIIIVLSFLSKSFLTVTNLNNVTRQVAFVVITGCAVTPLMTVSYTHLDVYKRQEVNNLTTHKLKNVNFNLYKGEILGFYGLRGAGKTEIALALFGLDRVLSGDIRIEGKSVLFDLPRDSMLSGISMVPEERLTEGLIMKLPVQMCIRDRI